MTTQHANDQLGKNWAKYAADRALERRVLAAGFLAQQPTLQLTPEMEVSRQWTFTTWLAAFLMAGIGWFLIGVMVLGIVGLLGVFAI